MKLLDSAAGVCYALLIVFIGLSLVVSLADRRLSELGLESIAPDNLRSAAERFRLELAAERNMAIRQELAEADSGQVLEAIEENSASIDRMAESEAWNALETGLDKYAERLELLAKQRQSASMILISGTAAVGVVWVVLLIARARLRKRLRELGEAGGAVTDPESRIQG